MYHTFSTTPQDDASSADPKQLTSTQRKSFAVRACEPCRRRKVKCSGDTPCESCRWYGKSEQCQYTEPGRRTTSSKRPGDKAVHSLLHQHRNIVHKLFPDAIPEELVGLSREELIDLIMKDSPQRPPQPTSPLNLTVYDTRPHLHPDADSLETFQPLPEEGSEASDHHPTKSSGGAQDDVNALSLSVRATTSYLGISSVMAVVRIIVWLDPDAQTAFRKSPNRSTAASREVTSPSTPVDTENAAMQVGDDSNSAWDEIPEINSYFTFFHPMVPMLDEQSFRDTYITRRRSDARWLLLLNIVLALGSAVNGRSTDSNHRIYYSRAQQYLTLDTFGSAHLETVQALALLSGYYLHYLQLPNQANSLMGTTLRMATALGLHRDYFENVALSKQEKALSSVELRRRIWWCIVCLDSWASISLGRPAMGRTNHAVTAKPPQQPIGNSMQILLLLQENIQFALISTKQEDTLAYSPIIDEEERKMLDTAYTEWFKASSTQDDTPRPSVSEAIGLSVMKCIMRWRYLWCRVVLHRPVLLWYAMRQISFSKLSSERQATINLCRELTGDLINDIASTWAGRNRCTMSAWHAAWLLYQAAMVPLLSLFSDWTDTHVLERSHAQIQTAIKILSDQVEYTHTAKRSLEVVIMIYEAGQNHRPRTLPNIDNLHVTEDDASKLNYQSNAQAENPGYIDIHSAHQFALAQNLDTPHQEMVMNNMFDSLNWSSGWVDGSDDWVDFNSLSFPFDYMDPSCGNNQQYLSSYTNEGSLESGGLGSNGMSM